MAQHDYTIANQGFPAFRSDLNDALAAIVSNNSGATEPTTMFAHQMWVDTAANPSILKIRNADNDAWVTIGSIDQTGDTFTLTSAVSATTLNTSGAVVFNDAGADVDFRVEGDTDANLLFVDAGNDRVGIGTSSPSGRLQVAVPAATLNNLILSGSTTSGSYAQFSNTGGSFYVGLDNSAGTEFGTAYSANLYHTGAYPIVFWTNGSERMRITSGGNLLCGLTTDSTNSRAFFYRDSIATTSIVLNNQNNSAISTTKAASTILRVASNANGADVHITCTDNIANTYFYGGNNGGAYVMANSNGVRLSSGGTSWASDSDERIKDIIEPITDGLNKVNSLRPVIGKYKTDDEEKRRVFLIAQDVQAVLPEAVFENEDTLMLQYTDVIPLLVSAVKDLKAELDTVKAELATLKG